MRNAVVIWLNKSSSYTQYPKYKTPQNDLRLQMESLVHSARKTRYNTDTVIIKTVLTTLLT